MYCWWIWSIDGNRLDFSPPKTCDTAILHKAKVWLPKCGRFDENRVTSPGSWVTKPPWGWVWQLISRSPRRATNPSCLLRPAWVSGKHCFATYLGWKHMLEFPGFPIRAIFIHQNLNDLVLQAPENSLDEGTLGSFCFFCVLKKAWPANSMISIYVNLCLVWILASETR